MTEPKVIILILNYNRYNDTFECISSLNDLTYSNFEILLVDNNSPDNSFLKFEEKFPHIKKYKTSENLGYTGGINFGLKKAIELEPEFILLLNNDTIVEPDFLEHMVNEVVDKDNVAASCGLILAEHDRETIWYAGGKLLYWRGSALHLLKGKNRKDIEDYSSNYVNFITGCMILLRADLLNKIGLEDERYFMYLDDIELSARIIQKGYKLLYIPKAIIYHKVLNEETSPLKRYYSFRNRFLLIGQLNKGLKRFIAYFYFSSVLLIKLIYWSVFNKTYFKAAKTGFVDYLNKNFYKGRGHDFFNNY